MRSFVLVVVLGVSWALPPLSQVTQEVRPGSLVPGVGQATPAPVDSPVAAATTAEVPSANAPNLEEASTGQSGSSDTTATAPAPALVMAQAKQDDEAPKCSGKNCKPNLSKSCQNKLDGCRNETECCEIDKCNIWQHMGRENAGLLVFYVSWCPVSRDFMLNYDLLRTRYEPFDNLLVAKVDADQNPNLVGDFGVEEYPSLVFFRRDCYWSPMGCYDQMAWNRYNGTSNDYDEVTRWIEQQLMEEQNANTFRQLPGEPETDTGCKVSKTSLPPEDMRDAPSKQAPAQTQ
jgi:hypothetical protein